MFKMNELIGNKLDEIFKELAPKEKITLKYYLIETYINNRKIISKFKNLDNAMSYYHLQDKNKTKIKIFINNVGVIELKKIQKFSTNKNLRYGQIKHYIKSFNNSENRGDCFDENFYEDFIEMYDSWKLYRNGIEFQGIHICLHKIGIIDLGYGYIDCSEKRYRLKK